MRFYQAPGGWFFRFSFQENFVGFGIFKSDLILFARLIRLVDSVPLQEIKFEELPPNIQTIITAAATCMVETAHTDIKELSKKG